MDTDKDGSPTRKARSTAEPEPAGGRAPVAGADTQRNGEAPAAPATRDPGRAARPSSRTRLGGAWTALAVAIIVLVLLLVFILQNQQLSSVNFLGASGSLPLGVLVLLSAAGGALLVVVLGAARMIQLKALARKQRRDLTRGKR